MKYRHGLPAINKPLPHKSPCQGDLGGRPGIATRIIEAFIDEGVQTRDGLFAVARRLSRGQSRLPNIADLRAAYLKRVDEKPDTANPILDRMLRRRDVRSLSGVAIVTVLTKPWPCPGQCAYCPNEVKMPKSYLSNEPAAMRALSLKFDPWLQVTRRLEALTMNGHPNDKIELIVKGGTWSSYRTGYQDWFIRRCFDAANDFGRKRRQAARTLKQSQGANETAGHRIIGLTLETRPDCVTPKEIRRLRHLGCTRVEMGVQSLDDDILKSCRRGHGQSETARATKLLKESGFKVDYHLMPQLPGASPASDLDSMHQVFSDPRFRPDMVKIYPCVVIKNTALYDWWESGEYRPYPTGRLVDVLIRFKSEIPRYCRISRLARDIPSTSIIAGNAVTNLRQVIGEEMKRRKMTCRCLRCREIGHVSKDNPRLADLKPKLFVDRYESSGGQELFLSFEDSKRRAVFAFCRLRLPNNNPDQDVGEIRKLLPEIKNAAFVRELHTYGNLVSIGTKNRQASQHKGLGAKLMAEAERQAKRAGFRKLAVISGIGVRDYYRKLGYRLNGTYMTKSLQHPVPAKNETQ
ncbi:tRNA uridine(34) 5-carboxymethylaminomethyl modification radical SAM/GNAT enzyme Elp3 [Candidatus Uhrbacteria bacterium]|nr:tRNA uridine(34) 5-carboxymethylaminomethyl modification radical SAM/GNAT enzyme Elp3 [Candidatus Uhrbacteria bacterium]